MLTLLALMATTPLEPCFAEANGRNILFIAVDDLRPELGCYGNSEIQSPNIDAFAEQSVRFNRAYCQQAVCNPSRASLLTGLRPDATKVWDLVTHFRDTIPSVVTLPQHFRGHGYRAVAYGKIFHNPLPDLASWDEPNHWPESATNWSSDSIAQLKAYREAMQAEGKSAAAIQRMRAPALEAEDVPDSQRPDGEIADQAITAMRQFAETDEPFFLAVGFIKPHLPFNPPKKYWDMYDPEKLSLAPNQQLPEQSPAGAMNTMYELRDYMDFADSPPPRLGKLDEARQRRLKHGYYASVSFADAQVGRLLEELDRLGLADDTIVVLWGDHGWKLGEHGSWCKQTNYEIDTRVPLIIRVPGTTPTNAACESIVEFVDIYPTLCDLAGLSRPEQLQGKSLVPLLEEPSVAWARPAFSQFPRRVKGGEVMGYAMRTEQYRYVEWLDRATCELTAVELYDHDTDPAENRNIASEPENQPTLDQLARQMWIAIRKPSPGDLAKPAVARPVIRFQNNGSEAVEIFWINHDGNRITQGIVQPGKQLNITTTKSHEFQIGADRDTPVVRVTKPLETIVIGAEVEQEARQEKRPNILFIAMDDLNDWIGCMGGHPQAITPNLDRLAASGVLFTNAHCPAPACNPCRTAVFTGRSPHKTGLYENRQKMRQILPTAEIIPKTFSRHGYHSSGSGKMLHYFIDAPSWDDYFPEAEKENPFPRTLYPEKRPVSLPRGGPWQYVETDWAALDATDEEFGGDYLVTKWIGEQLAIEREKPFFLACGLYRPHEPWFVPKKYFEPFPLDSIQLPIGYKADDLDDLPPAGKRFGPNRYFPHIRKHGQWKQGIQGYLASIYFADTMLGRVLDALDSSPHADNTIVVLWSDHGWHLGEKEHWQKFTCWRACTRVPLMIRVPKGVAGLANGTKPAVCDRPVNLLSLFPTLLELCGLPAEAHHDGPSLVPLLTDTNSEWPHASLTYLHQPGSYSVSGQRWRLIHYANGDEELYDIKTDPYEWTNLAGEADHVEKRKELRAFAPTEFAELIKPE